MMTLNARTLTDVLDYLQGLCRDGATPGEALNRLGSLRRRWPELDLDLLWEETADARHYDVLVRQEGGTFSLSFCPARAVPWPLRHAHHSREWEFARINGRSMEIGTVVACLDFLWDERRLTDRLIDSCLIQDEIERRGLTVSDTDLQTAMDAFRSKRGLFTAEAAERWLREHGLTREALEQRLELTLAPVLLREQMAQERGEDSFAEWLDEQRHSASIEWFWGREDAASAAEAKAEPCRP
jgi:putative peptide maturation system protein